MARREGFEPPAFWSVGCLKGKSEPFRLRFVLFTTVRSADFPLFPSSPARFFRILGQKWVRHGVPAPTPTASRSSSHRRRQQDRPRRPHHSCSPAEYRWPPEQNWFTIERGSPGRKLFGLFSYSPKLRLSCSQVLWYNLNTKIEQQTRICRFINLHICLLHKKVLF